MTPTRSLVFGDAHVGPGEKARGVARVSEGEKSVRLAVGVINGSSPGPHFVAIAGLHGQELNGVAAIHSFFEKVNPSQLSGTIFVIPCANPRAAMMRSYAWPEDQHAELVGHHGDGPYPPSLADKDKQRLNMQRLWPGRKGGLLAERVTHEIWTQAINAPHRRADLVIDMHCYHRETPGAIVLPDEHMIPFGVAAGMPNIINMRYKPDTPFCTAVCRRAGINALIIENSGQGCVTPDSAEEGERVLLNLARYMKMLPGEPALPDQAVILDPWLDDDLEGKKATTSVALECSESAGLFVPHRWPFDVVEKGEILGEMVDLYTGRVTQTVRAPCSGCLYVAGASLGVCDKGQRLIGVAICEQLSPREILGQRPFTPERCLEGMGACRRHNHQRGRH